MVEPSILIQNLALLLSNYVTSDKFLNLSAA